MEGAFYNDLADRDSEYVSITGIKADEEKRGKANKDKMNSPDLWELSRLEYFVKDSLPKKK
jgi:hypothetical protein